jgi:signal peptidase I
MSMTLIRWTRRLLAFAWMAALLCCIGVAVVGHLSDAIVIRGASMEPAVPLGSLVMLGSPDGPPIRGGDIVTVRADNGVLVTHRVSRILDLADGRFLELRGDANDAPDPALVPVSSAIGRVEWTLPHVGYLAGVLSVPLGLLSILSLLGVGMLAIWFLEDLESVPAPIAAST